MTETDSMLEPQPALNAHTIERLRNAASAAASWDVVHRPGTPCAFLDRIRAVRRTFKHFERDLVQPPIPYAKEDPNLSSYRATLDELRGNHRLLRSTITAITAQPQRIARLPRILQPGQPDEPRIAVAARTYFQATDGVFAPSTFRLFIEALQAYEPLTVNELWQIGTFSKFILLELLLNETAPLLRSPNSVSNPRISIWLSSLRAISHCDWNTLVEPLIAFDPLLRQDPAQTYEKMDGDTRRFYLRRIAVIASRSDCSEVQVTQAALDLARQGEEGATTDPRVRLRNSHIGYYLIGSGFPQLARQVSFHPPLAWRVRQYIRAHAEDFYIGGIQLLTILIVAAVIFPQIPRIKGFLGLFVALVVILLPAMQNAVELVNHFVSLLFEPDPLPKLDFSKGIPSDCATLVAVPTLLLNEAQVRDLVNDLEVRFLANQDANLHFALLTDLPDSVSKPRVKDTHPLVELATRLIDELNVKYCSPTCGNFVLLHRHRVFNTRQGVWMGWERKRGKLLDLNKLLTGEYDAFPIKAGRVEALERIRYILTLDSDTQLPRDSAARLVGAIAHPLNQAIIDQKLKTVTSGYGILQPRIGIAVPSTVHSRLAAIFSGHTGFDIYTRAISDVYQDLFGEAIFTGKGIYEVAALHAVLNRRFPRNALLSHDLIEGAYARAGLATDIELIDDYPSHFSAYSRRKHRWVRGDWQIAQWIFSRVPDESGRAARNPISDVSRWKIFDNLRRSLVEPSLLLLFMAGWIGLPGGPLYWTIVPLVLLFLPAVVRFVVSLACALSSERKGQISEAFAGFWRSSLVTLLHLILLPHQTLLALDAIGRSLIRRLITGERLLEWETAAQAELRYGNRTPVDRYLAAMPLVTAGLAALVWLFAEHSNAILCAAPILLLWLLSTPVTAWLNKPPRKRQKIASSDKDFLVTHALRIWRYFRQFSSARHNYLIPDNVEEDGLFEAARVSPTNIGLLLNTRQAAVELGFLTVREFAELSSRTLATIGRLEKHRGHLYNWYDTQTLQPLEADPFVSSVDSGNFVASLYTLHTGTLSLIRKPLLASQLFAGLHAYWRMMRTEDNLLAPPEQFPLPDVSADTAAWIAWLPAAEIALSTSASSSSDKMHDAWWLYETRQRVNAILAILRGYLPWTLPEFKPLQAVPQLAFDSEASALSLKEALSFAEVLDARMIRGWNALDSDPSLRELGERFRSALAIAIRNLRALSADLHAIAQDAERLAAETEFRFLTNPGRHILSIGYNVRAQQLHDACYDMLASEARIATFLAIAHGELPTVSWSRLARDHTYAHGRFLLLSWTGTMFEYLMPALWMRNYPDTLMARSLQACVHVQRAFARSMSIPWGISESGDARKDDAGHYHYHAYGIPSIALWFEANAGPVVSPYSTFLALGVDQTESLRNLRRMDSAGWVGAFGFYESADFTESKRKPGLTREWMAHHQGMSLLAITNLLHDNIVQNWFHANPLVQATELLLHEMPLNKAIMRARLNEFVPIRPA